MAKKDEYRREAINLEELGIIVLLDKETPQKLNISCLKISKKKFLKTYVGAARRFFIRDKKFEELKEKRDASRERILKLFHLGSQIWDIWFLGLEIPSENLRLVVYPKVTTEYDKDLLEKSAGPLFTSIAFEDLILRINLPKDLTTREKVVAKIRKALGEKTYLKLVTEESELRIDEEELNRLIVLGKIKLLEGTRTESTNWNVKVSPLRKE